MPTLNWVGKDKVVNHHHEVPFRVLKKVSTFAAPDGLPKNSTENRIIHGDNLEALKSLLPEFEGQVKCIYIDPPYNTGNEGWVYNDAVNDPKIKRWLGQVVGKEGEDLSRHDKWLCMMYPRLKLLHKLLAQDGVIFISIDGNEMVHLSLLVNEIFGPANFLARFVWKRKAGGGDDNEHIATEHEYVLCYAKKKSSARINRVLHESPAMTAKYNRSQNGRRYYLERLDKTSLTYSESMDFPIECPDGTYISPPQPDPSNPTTAWRWGPKSVEERRAELEFHRDRKTKEWRVYTRTWEPLEGVTPRSLLVEKDFGRNRDGTQELDAILGPKKFNNPKPTKLLLHLLTIGASDKNALILDSFAGSGSTAHAVLKMNASDGGNRRFILCEMMDYAPTVTAERVRRVMSGFGDTDGKFVPGLGGGFGYYSVGESMFQSDDNLNEVVGTEAIRCYVAYSEGIPANELATTENPHSPYLLGLSRDTAWIFNYEPDRATSLDMDFLSGLRFGGSTGASKPGTVIIYADRCLLSAAFMAQHGIIFKKIPRDITRF